jgi:tetratricopeptide (TPR) repeat protein
MIYGFFQKDLRLAEVLCSVLIFIATFFFTGAIAVRADDYTDHRGRNLAQQAFDFMNNHEPAKAVPLLEEAAALDPNSWYYQYNLALAYSDLKQPSKAFPHYQAAWQLDQTKPQSWLGLAECYRQSKDYVHAVYYFGEYVNRFPDRATPYTYLNLGESLAETRRISEAVQSWKRAVSLRPTDPEVAYNQIFQLNHYGCSKEAASACRNFLKRFPENSYGDSVGKILEYQNYKDSKKQFVDGALSQSNKRDDLDEFVTVMDPKGKDVSPRTVALVRQAIRNIPYAYREALENAGYKLVIPPELIDVLPELDREHPRGWEERATWHNANGTFYRKFKWIVVGEKYADLKTGALVVDPTIERTARHEFGHAYDFFLGEYASQEKFSNSFEKFSSSAAFGSAYSADVAHLPERLKKPLHYFLQPDKVGAEELFAQMFPLLYGGAPMPGSPEELFSTAFPRVLRVMQGSLEAHNLRIKDVYQTHVKNLSDTKR